MVRQGDTSGPLPVGCDKNPITYLDIYKKDTIALVQKDCWIRARGLFTCASVIYSSADPNSTAIAHVHHVTSGGLTDCDITEAKTALGNPNDNTIHVVIAHPNKINDGYGTSISTLIRNGIPENNIVEIASLPLCEYGINSLKQIG